MRGGKGARKKGDREERALAHLLQRHGLAAERVPLSGQAGGRFGGDVSVPVLGDDWRLEVKVRGRDFLRLYAWLAGADALVVRADRQAPLLVLPLSRALAVLKVAEGDG